MPPSEAKENISIQLEGWLIERLDEACEQLDINRSIFIRRAIRRYLLINMDSPGFWKKYNSEAEDKSY